MLRIIATLFGLGQVEPAPAAEAPEQAPLSDAMKAHLVRWALSTLGLTYPAEDDFYVEAFVAETGFVSWQTLLRRGEMLSKDELRALGLNPARKVARQYVETLTAEGRRDVVGSAVRIAATVHVALRNRTDLDYFSREMGGRTKVQLQTRGGDPPRCERGRDWAENATWACVAPDLPVAGCDAECDCHYRIVLDLEADEDSGPGG
ncbi:hypothetical protein MEX01_48220 [Methylorubrum extorquens]|uniref:hypothetical protein n=1 Tax=Methylorubrum extorquens TaxID=408 RepID=UPI001169D629|nr:hypothetical protein [Methylorubrum extorquens]GEL44231.1 hypothetical protein MEX01_48220 [Methylorubrum extorquens]